MRKFETLEPRELLSGMQIIDNWDSGYSEQPGYMDGWINGVGDGFENYYRKSLTSKGNAVTFLFDGLDNTKQYRVASTWADDENVTVWAGTNDVAQDTRFEINGIEQFVDQTISPDDFLANDEFWETLSESVSPIDGKITVKIGGDVKSVNTLQLADAVLIDEVMGDLPDDPLRKETLQAGDFLDPSIWEDGTLPTPEDDLSIEHDVTLDGNGYGRYIDVQADASLSLLEGSTLHAYESVTVWGSYSQYNADLLFYVEDDRDFVGGHGDPGPIEGLADYKPGDTGFWAMPNSHVDLRGDWVTPYSTVEDLGNETTLFTQDRFGNNVSEMEQYGRVDLENGHAILSKIPVGWEVGDRVLLLAPDGRDSLTTLTDVQGNEVWFEDTDFVAKSVIYKDTVYVTPYITNLTREAKIGSALVVEGDDNHRAHTMFMRGADVNIVGVEFYNLGPKGKVQGFSRYPIHFHHAIVLPEHDGGLVQDNAVWSEWATQNRAVTVHGVPGSPAEGWTIDQNIAYNSEGHVFFSEQGHENGITWTNNLSAGLNGEGSLEEFVRRDSEFDLSLVDDPDRTPGRKNRGRGEAAHFFLWDSENPDLVNIFDGNIAHGHFFHGTTPLRQSGHAAIVNQHDLTSLEPVIISNHLSMGVNVGPWGWNTVDIVDSTTVHSRELNFTSSAPLGGNRHPVTKNIRNIGLLNARTGGQYAHPTMIFEDSILISTLFVQTHGTSAVVVRNSEVDANLLLNFEGGGVMASVVIQDSDINIRRSMMEDIPTGDHEIATGTVIQIENSTGEVVGAGEITSDLFFHWDALQYPGSQTFTTGQENHDYRLAYVEFPDGIPDAGFIIPRDYRDHPYMWWRITVVGSTEEVPITGFGSSGGWQRYFLGGHGSKREFWGQDPLDGYSRGVLPYDADGNPIEYHVEVWSSADGGPWSPPDELLIDEVVTINPGGTTWVGP